MDAEEFLAAEMRNRSWVDKALGRKPWLRTTGQMSAPIRQQKPARVLRPSWFVKFLGCWFMLFIGIFYPTLIGVLLEGSGLQKLGALCALLLLTYALRHLAWNTFRNPRLHYRIRIDGNSISLGDEPYTWTEIAETAMLQNMQGRYEDAHLVLFLNDGNVRVFDLDKFGITATRLAGIIEFYKRSGATFHQPDSHN